MGYLMVGKMRLFVEVEGMLIPIAVRNEQKVLESLGIIELPRKESRFILGDETGTVTSISLTKLKTKDITKYIAENLEKGHSTRSLARHFMIDVGEGTSKKTHEQVKAYNKLYGCLLRARIQISKKMNGQWTQTKMGFKNAVTTWIFRKNETGA